MLIVPHYNKYKFVDHCYWCHDIRCKRSHGLEMAEYRAKLKLRAKRRLGFPRKITFKWPEHHRGKKVTLAFEHLVWAWLAQDNPEAVRLLSLRPEQMTMADHRLKGHYLRFRKTMESDDAWEAAHELSAKESNRSRNEFPRFTEVERLNIKRFKGRRI